MRRAFSSAIRETIFALSSGSNRAGVAVVRVSGPEAADALRTLGKRQKLPPPRSSALTALHDARTGELLDANALALWFPQPRSYTGEDVAELHVHGNPLIVRDVLRALGHVPGCRAAEPGEFTRRAFENGKLDLTQVEALADLLGAETEQQRRQALTQMRGALGRLYREWRAALTDCLAHVEAVIDFGDDEEDVDDEQVLAGVAPRLDRLRRAMEAHLADGRRGEIVRCGLSVAIAGPPNAGKSSLLNALAQRPAAIVSPQPGTTRDVIDVALNLGGFAVNVADTAGVRSLEAVGHVEQEGIRLARERARDAEVVVVVLDADDVLKRGRAAVESSLLAEPHRTLLVFNKMDLVAPDAAERERLVAAVDGAKDMLGIVHCSALQSEGVSGLVARLKSHAEERLVSGEDGSRRGRGEEEAAVITRERHRELIEEAVDHLAAFQAGEGDLVLAAERLRLALRAVSKILGHVDVEELLDVIFRDFCVGK